MAHIVIATPLYPPAIGGPAQYAQNLAREFKRAGHQVRVITSGPWSGRFPTGLRHLAYFFRVLTPIWRSDWILALDTFSVGWPVALAARLARRRLVIRIGGDFLWESCVERTGDLVPLSRFYLDRTALNFKERLIFKATKWLLRQAKALAFTTDWQKNLWQKPYNLASGPHSTVIQNYFGPKQPSVLAEAKTYLLAGRDIKLKNAGRLRQAFAEAKRECPEIELVECHSLPRRQLKAVIAKSYAVIVPSVSEVSPNLALEALQFNKPLILTRDCGLAVELSEVSLLVDPLSTPDLKSKILTLANADEYQRWQARIKAWVKLREWDQVAQDFLTLFESL